MKKLIIIAIAIVAIAGCKTTKTSSTTSAEVVKDSLKHVSTHLQEDSSYIDKVAYDTVYVEKTRASSSDVNLGNPCDSLTGLLRKFELKAGQTKVASDGKSISIISECEELVKYYQSESREVSRYIRQLEYERDSLLLLTESKTVETYMAETKTRPFWHKGKWWAVGGLIVCGLLMWLIWKFGK